MFQAPPSVDYPPSSADDVSSRRWNYRQKTALLGSFDATALETQAHDSDAAAPESEAPGSREPGRELREFLTHDCERVTTRQGRRWRLVQPVRSATLDQLGTTENLLRALRSAAQGAQDAARNWAEALLLGSMSPLDELGFDELHAALTVVGWFDGAPRARAALAERSIALPSADDVRHHIERARLLLPLRALVDETFCGRARELDLLADHVAARHRPWLMIHGPGGMGKSTLLARFLLEHMTSNGPSPTLAFAAYLSFDRADLLPEQPLTLLAETVRQLRLLVPSLSSAAEKLEHYVRSTLQADSRAEAERRSSGQQRKGHDRDERRFIRLFADLVRTTLSEDRLALLILDTFEQVQRKGPIAVARHLDFLDMLQFHCPALRIVAAGRAPVDDPRFTGLSLEGFDPATAHLFLRRQLPGEGAEYEAALHSITQVVGSDPLSLKLAASLIGREGPRALLDAALRRQIQLRLQPEEVQGVLYRRILDHLDDPDLRRIASPGLTVRKVTPDVIREVLAGPCGLGRVDDQRARALFRMLRDEAALVEDVPGQEAVTHRSDVRRVMLPLLHRDAEDTVKRIHRKAIAYYRWLPETDPVTAAEHRAEELYHRLSLEQASETLDRRWLAEAGPLLDSALDELPVRGRVYLSERLGLTVAPELRAQADDELWGRQALRAGTALLADGSAEDVVALLDERPGQVGDDLALATLRIRALATLGRTAEAYSLVDRALDLASDASDAAGFVEIALLGARIDEDRGRFDAALGLLSQAQRAAEAPGTSEATVLSVAAAQLRLHRRGGTLETEEAQQLRADVLEHIPRFGSRNLARYPSLVRELAAEVGEDAPSLVSQTARLQGIDFEGGAGEVLRGSLTDDDLLDFAETTRAHVKSPPSAGDDTPAVRPGGDPTEDPSAWLVGNTTVARGELVGDFLDSDANRQPSWNQALVATYQHEVDQAPFTISEPDGHRPEPSPLRTVTGDAVVIVPGFMGSALVDETTGKYVWGAGSLQGWARAWLQGVSALRVTDRERANEKGHLRAVSLLDRTIWAPFLAGLEPYGRLLRSVRSCVIHPDAVLEFPYDWRLPVARNARTLAEAAIRHLASWRRHPELRRARRSHAAEPEPRLVFVTHSMGGLVAYQALRDEDELVARTRELICIGTPFQGTPRAVEMISGQRSSPLSLRRMHEVSVTMPGLYDLLPDYRCVEDADQMRRLTLQDISRLGGDVELAEAALRNRALSRHVLARMPRITTVVGTGQPTVQSIALTDQGVRPLPYIARTHSDGSLLRDRDGVPLRWDVGGDGVVPRDSARLGPPSSAFFVPGRHGALAADSTVVNHVRSSLTEQPLIGPGSAGTAVPGTHEVGPGRTSPVLRQLPPDGGGIGLPAAPSAGLGLSMPDVAESGRRWEVSIRGATPGDRVVCTVVDTSTGHTIAVLQPRTEDDVLVGDVTVDAAGLYRIIVEAAHSTPVSGLVLIVDTESIDATGDEPLGTSTSPTRETRPRDS
jgi:tetratricopeptide (TPR) repeat protein